MEDYYDNKQVKLKTSGSVDPSTLTIGELIKILKPSNLWAIMVGLAGLISGAFALGQFFAK